ncbi:MAG: hypothetical protein WB784_10345 [Rhodanobacteraceae bacterium]
MPILYCRRILVLVVALASAVFTLTSFGADSTKAGATNDVTPAQIIARFKPGESRASLFDMHGNANQDLQSLMVLRFDATNDIMRGIDRMQGDSHFASVMEALFNVLGFVKDPASIEWLREKRRSDAESFYRDYLPAWAGRLQGFGSWEWLTGRDQWIAFWLDAFHEERSPERRITLLSVLSQFDDASIVSFFSARRAEMKDPKEVLLVESYLDAHALPANGERVAWAVGTLRHSPKNDDFLISMADSLRHEAFVPFLVGVSDKTESSTFPPYYDAERDLQAITFECDLHGKAAWQNWYVAHGKEGRAEWMRSAIDTFRANLASRPKEAVNRFEKLVYCWNDIVMQPFVEGELAPHPEFHSAIAGWINLTYSNFYRERLRPLAERVGADDHIENWARHLLQERGYISGRQNDTWAEAVRRANSRV